jgi:uncharacterized protein
MSLISHTVNNETFCLSPERVIYWEQMNTLILSDIHLGKSGHFRKEGIGIPQPVFKEDLQRLLAQIQFFRASSLIVVGDFFHSRLNNEIGLFERWRKDLSSLEVNLVMGNHDILPLSWYAANNITLHNQKLLMNKICFVHDYSEADAEPGCYTISGHLHPGVRIEGMAKQSLRFPCFYFTDHYAVLPAFGRFTGLHPVKPKKKDKVFAIVNKTVLDISR